MAKIPPEIEELIYSQEVEDALIRIANEEDLHVDQLGDLHDSVNMVFLGEIHPSDFVTDIKRMLNLSDDKAKSVSEKVNEQVFLPARELLKERHAGKEMETDVLDQNFEAKNVLRAISNPTSIPTTSTVTEKLPVIEAPIAPQVTKLPTAPLPDMNQIQSLDAEDIHLQKFADVTVSSTKSSEQNIVTKKTLIPADHIERINSDPYKENVV